MSDYLGVFIFGVVLVIIFIIALIKDLGGGDSSIWSQDSEGGENEKPSGQEALAVVSEGKEFSDSESAPIINDVQRNGGPHNNVKRPPAPYIASPEVFTGLLTIIAAISIVLSTIVALWFIMDRNLPQLGFYIFTAAVISACLFQALSFIVKYLYLIAVK